MSKHRLALRLGVLGAVAALSLTACGAGNDAEEAVGDDVKTITIGVADGGEPYWQVYKKKVKEETGVEVKFKNFSDYNQPNKALNEGELEMNEFQHLQYLANSNVKQKQTLQPITATAVYPLPLYSKKYDSVEDFKKGDKVAIPNDPVNSARSLGVLSEAGLVTLKKPFSTVTTIADLDKDKSKVEIVAVDAKQTAQQVDGLAGAIVNNNYATAAKLSDDDIVTSDDPNSDVAKPYINIFVVREQDKDNKTLKAVADVYHDPEVEKAIVKDLGESGVFKTNDAKDLQDTLAEIEQDIKDNGGAE
ncbi:MAG: MetQ/NlpA family ABC transporter substrate-binding protein [Galactobacter sp.]